MPSLRNTILPTAHRILDLERQNTKLSQRVRHLEKQMAVMMDMIGKQQTISRNGQNQFGRMRMSMDIIEQRSRGTVWQEHQGEVLDPAADVDTKGAVGIEVEVVSGFQ